MIRRAGWIEVFTVAVTLFVGSSNGRAQVPTGVIECEVVDSSGALVVGASASVVEVATDTSRSLKTDSSGRFRAFSLKPGVYTVKVDHPGFRPNLLKEVKVSVGQVREIRVVLFPSAADTTVSVSSGPASSSHGLEDSQRISDTLIHSLPADRRDFASFITLTPTASLLESRYGSTLTLDGQKGIYSSISIDGADDNNPFYGERAGGELPEFTMSLSTVEEFQVLSDGAPAEYGRATGGFVNVVSRSGSNDLHGSGLFQFRNPSLASENPLAEQAQEASDNPRQYQFGASLGGPIQRDKLFFFLGYDQNDGTISKANRIDPALVAIFSKYFNDPNEQGAITRSNGANAGLAKADWHINANNDLSVRYAIGRADLMNGDFDVPSWGRSSNGLEHDVNNTGIVELSTHFSARNDNVARLMYEQEDRKREYVGPNFADVTIAGSDPVTGASTAFRFGRPFFLPGAAHSYRYEALDTVSLSRGAHFFKFGVDANLTYIVNPFLGQGRYIFDSTSDFQAYLNNPSSLNGLLLFSQNVPLGGRTLAQAGTQSFWQTVPEVFVQDQWHPTSKTTVNYGIRYMAQLEPQPVTPLSKRLYAQFVGSPGFPSNGSIPSEKSGWQPRLGVAWAPGDGKTVIRGNVGIYYTLTTGLTLFAARTYDGTISGTINSCCGSSPVPPPNLGFLSGSQTFQIANPGVSVYASNFHDPRALLWSASFQRELPGQISLSGGFRYVNTVHEARLVNRNSSTFIGHFAADGRKLFDGPAPFSKSDGSGIGALDTTESTARSLYKAFTLSLEKKLVHRVTFFANYTLSWDRSYDDTETDPFLLQYADITDLHREWAFSDRDQRHRLNAATLVNGPWGIQWTATFQARSASPYSIFLSTDANEDGNNYDRPYVNGHDIGRNTARLADQFYSWDNSFGRVWKVKDRFSVQPYVTLFNTLNNANLRGLSDSLLFNFDGFIRSGFGTPREAQFGVSMKF